MIKITSFFFYTDYWIFINGNTERCNDGSEEIFTQEKNGDKCFLLDILQGNV